MDGIARMLRGMSLVGVLAGALLAEGGAHAQTAPVPPPFAPVTIADLGPITTNQPWVGWLGMSGQWAIYALDQPGCGHCQPSLGEIYLQHLGNTTRIHIPTTVAHFYGGSMSSIGISDLRLVNGNLYWTQPDATTAPPPTYTLIPGKYNCTHCYYDIARGQGGSGDPPAVTPYPMPSAAVERGPAPTYKPQTLVITNTAQFKDPLRIPVADEDELDLVATNGQQVIYTTLIRRDGSDYGAEQLIRAAAIMPPIGGFDAFNSVWGKADAAVKAGTVPRTWLWGPKPRYIGVEDYAGLVRPVVYYDKSRMEVNHPFGDQNDPYYVTNGLLVAEMIGGQIQVGDTQTISAGVACDLPVVGDPRPQNPLSPGYADLAAVASLHGDHQAPDRSGQPVNDAIDMHGIVSTDAAHANLAHYAAFAHQTGHNIPDRFWTYLQGMQKEYGFDWTYVVGYPITEGYWTQMRVGGKDYPVLIQAFQRRVLTYIPDFAPEWQIQQGNVGQHYLEWRYTMNGLDLGSADGYVP